MCKIIRKFFANNPNVKYTIKNMLGKGCVYNVYNTKYNKNCLLVYITHPFNKEVDFFHQAIWQARILANSISKKGYNIDIIDYDNRIIDLKNSYDLVINMVPGQNNVFHKKKKPNCKEIAYFTGSNPSFQNNAELQRLEALESRKSVRLKARRVAPLLTKEVEGYTAAFMIGNEYNWKTFNEFKMPPVYFIKNTGNQFTYTFDDTKKDRNCFLYFGSSGQVHKGLDLLLEIFSRKGFPCELYVCGTFKSEKDFEELYKKELYETENIHPIGFVNVDSDLFVEITSKCVYSIMPSCSEGLAGSVLTTMSAGLINICSKECGLEDDEVINLDNCKIETIENAILTYSNRSMEWVKKESFREYKISQERYGKQNFIDSVEYALGEVLLPQ